MSLTTRHLRVAPDPEPTPRVLGVLSWLHSLNGAKLLQREAEHHVRVAKECGNEELAEAFEDVQRAAVRAERKAR